MKKESKNIEKKAKKPSRFDGIPKALLHRHVIERPRVQRPIKGMLVYPQ